jgi:hypothetical protein
MRLFGDDGTLGKAILPAIPRLFQGERPDLG